MVSTNAGEIDTRGALKSVQINRNQIAFRDIGSADESDTDSG